MPAVCVKLAHTNPLPKLFIAREQRPAFIERGPVGEPASRAVAKSSALAAAHIAADCSAGCIVSTKLVDTDSATSSHARARE